MTGGVVSLLDGLACFPPRIFRFNGGNHIVDSSAIMTITKLFMRSQQHHVYAKEHVGERWR